MSIKPLKVLAAKPGPGTNYVPNPFPGSKVTQVLYHGTNAGNFLKFKRPPQGIYVTPYRDWAVDYYSSGKGTVIPIYANVLKLKVLNPSNKSDDQVIDLFYDRDYSGIEQALKSLAAKGYNACKFGGESDSMVLFNNIQIVNAITGKAM